MKETATPIKTAYCSGSVKVAISVIPKLTRGTRPVYQMMRICSGCRLWTPTTISSPPSVAMGTSSMKPVNSSASGATSRPANMFAHRVREPDPTTNAVPDMEPPAGMPCHRLVAMLAIP